MPHKMTPITPNVIEVVCKYVITPVSAHHKYQQQYIELSRLLAWLGELQLTSASTERGGAAVYMQTIRRLIISGEIGLSTEHDSKRWKE